MFQGIIVFIMIDQINELPEVGLKSSPETLHFTENKWISRKNQNKLYFLHLNESNMSSSSYLYLKLSLLRVCVCVCVFGWMGLVSF